MKDVLEEIVAHKRVELEMFKQLLPEKELHAKVEAILGGELPSMKKALKLVWKNNHFRSLIYHLWQRLQSVQRLELWKNWRISVMRNNEGYIENKE